MKRWLAYPHFYNHDGRPPYGRVDEVEVLHQEANGSAIVKYERGNVSTAAGRARRHDIPRRVPQRRWHPNLSRLQRHWPADNGWFQ